MTKISVIIPVYNSEKYLKTCLNSIFNQTLNDLEVIAINDGSIDNSLNILNEYSEKYKNLKIINKKNEGQAIARNKGLSIANGEYISFIDSDDYIELDMYEKLYEAADSKCDIVLCNYKKCYSDHEEIAQEENFLDINNVSAKEYILSSPGPCNKIYKTSFLKCAKFKFPEGMIYEDYASIPLLGKYQPLIKYVNEPFLNYRQSENSTMRTDDYKKKYEDIIPATDYLVKNLKNTGFNVELEYLVIYHLLYLGSLNFFKYKKYDMIDKISDFMKLNFRKWNANLYYKNSSLKMKVLTQLFYRRKYNFILFVQRIKNKR